ncbi:hypothetical protein BO71DRAFT_21289 [Aspergillus ellipticus CBS 707.79]|uniref:Uncharacterized protein n=1 Tax=Aspergillus ellipticus CBS 707.79 TaxID=1448320 RepID=A0A319D520_9EURO|nr:hypothetical protein BO71DRAFT_21289 [Aspergillus ellipticus CBS 707.79]
MAGARNVHKAPPHSPPQRLATPHSSAAKADYPAAVCRKPQEWRGSTGIPEALVSCDRTVWYWTAASSQLQPASTEGRKDGRLGRLALSRPTTAQYYVANKYVQLYIVHRTIARTRLPAGWTSTASIYVHAEGYRLQATGYGRRARGEMVPCPLHPLAPVRYRKLDPKLSSECKCHRPSATQRAALQS